MTKRTDRPKGTSKYARLNGVKPYTKQPRPSTCWCYRCGSEHLWEQQCKAA